MTSEIFSSNSFVYEGLFRLYRNAGVEFIRTRLQQTKGEGWAEALRKPLAKEWDATVEAAERLRSGGTISSEVKDDADYLGLSSFYPVFEAYWADFWPEHAGDKVLRQNILTWARQAKLVRDPVAHPSDEDLDFNDAYGALDAARRILRYIDPGASDRVAALQDRLRGYDQPSPDSLVSYLPPREDVVIDFVGRRDVLGELHRWFREPLARRWLLCGDGGKGKSAIAYEFASEIAATAPRGYYLVIWLTGKLRRFTDGQTVDATPDFTDFDSVVMRLANAYGIKDPEADNRTQQELLGLLDELPALIIADDIDSLPPEQERAIEFLSVTLGGTKSKVLFTSRRVPFGWGGSRTEIAGLVGPDAEAFIDSRMRMFNIDPARLIPESRAKVLDVTDGSPLYMEDLLRLIKNIPPGDAIRSWAAKKGVAARRYSLEREVELLSRSGRKVLIALSLIEGPASIGELAITAGLAEDVVVDALNELGNLFLVPQPRLVEDQERYTLNINTRMLIRDVYEKTPDGRSIATAIQYHWEQASVPASDREAVAVCRQAVVLARASRFADAKRVVEAGLAQYPNHPKLLAQLAWIFKKWLPSQRLTDAREVFRRAADMKNRDPEMYWHWAGLEADQMEWDRVEAICEEGLRVARYEHAGLLWFAGRAQEQKATALTGALQDSAARKVLQAAADFYGRATTAAKSPSTPAREISRVYQSLVRVNRRLGRIQELDHALAEWSDTLPDDPALVNERASRQAR